MENTIGASIRRVGARLALLALATVAGCDSSADNAGKRPLGDLGASPAAPSTGDVLPPGMTAIAAARLDSGNVAYRGRQYAQALRFYRAAAIDVPAHPAPWYGIFMVAQVTGNRALADSATKAISTRSGGGDLLDAGNVKTHQTPEAASTVAPSHPAARPPN